MDQSNSERRSSPQIMDSSSSIAQVDKIAGWQRATVLDLIPNVGHRVNYAKNECDCYWNYGDLDPR